MKEFAPAGSENTVTIKCPVCWKQIGVTHEYCDAILKQPPSADVLLFSPCGCDVRATAIYRRVKPIYDDFRTTLSTLKQVIP